MANALKTTNLNVSIWYNKSDKSIHISGKNPDFISTINDNEGSHRCHKHLFKKLKEILITEGKFPLDNK
jgi:hypothetical protein